MRNQRGVTTVALAITVILMFLILSTILYSTTSVYQIEAINNMHVDIRSLEDKVAMYYLNYGMLPVKKDSSGNFAEVDIELEKKNEFKEINPNNDNIYYEIDVSLLGSLSLNYIEENDMYVINNQSHTIYYLPGIEAEGKMNYTIPIEYADLSEF